MLSATSAAHPLPPTGAPLASLIWIASARESRVVSRARSSLCESAVVTSSMAFSPLDRRRRIDEFRRSGVGGRSHVRWPGAQDLCSSDVANVIRLAGSPRSRVHAASWKAHTARATCRIRRRDAHRLLAEARRRSASFGSWKLMEACGSSWKLSERLPRPERPPLLSRLADGDT